MARVLASQVEQESCGTAGGCGLDPDQRLATDPIGDASSDRPAEGSIVARNVVAVVLNHVEAEVGIAGVDAVLAAVAARRERVEQVAPESWTVFRQVNALLEVVVETVGDPEVVRRAGAGVFGQPHMAPVVDLMRTLGTPADALALVADTAAAETAVVDLTVEEGRGDTAVLTLAIRAPLVSDGLLCRYAAGLLSAVPTVFGLAWTSLNEVECQANGAQRCRFHLAWGSHASVPHAGTGMGVGGRDDVLHDVAVSLASPDDLDRTLAEVVTGATGAAGARQGLLTVQLPGDKAPRVFAVGLDDDQARCIGSALRDPTVKNPQDWLVTGIDGFPASPGILAVERPAVGSDAVVGAVGRGPARSPGADGSGGSGGPGGAGSIAPFAALASIAVRTAACMVEARFRSKAAGALVLLLTELAGVKRKSDLARILADAAPAVLGCSRAVVLEWAEDDNRLVELARNTSRASLRAETLPVVACRSFVERLARSGQPISLRSRITEPVVEDLCRIAGIDTGAVVPLVSRSRCFGVLVVDAEPDHVLPTSSAAAEGVRVAAADLVHRGPGGALSECRDDVLRAPLRSLADLDALVGLADAAALVLDRLLLANEVSHQALHDQLTGLPNMNLLRVLGQQAMAGAQRDGESIGMLYLDLDRFSEINDRFGRAAGDEVLVEVARRLSAGVRQSDLPARPGGDEFAVLLPSVSSTDEAEAVAARIIDCFAEPVLVRTTELALTASVGIALSEPTDDFDAFLIRADRAMYVAKAAGPGQVRLVA